MFMARKLFDVYEDLLNVPPKRSYIRIEALLAEVSVKLQHLEGKLRELEVIAAQ